MNRTAKIRSGGSALVFLAAVVTALCGGTAAVADSKRAAAGGEPRPAAQSPAVPQNAAPGEALAGYRLGAGDRIRLTVYGEPELTGTFNVDGSGYLGVPLIGKVEAGGATAEELAARITDKLSPDYLKDPSVTVEVMQYRPFYIVGEVKQPGSYPYVSGMSVINAVALSGGFTYRADEDDFEIQRREKDKVREIEALPDTEVLPGDVVIVSQRFF